MAAGESHRWGGPQGVGLSTIARSPRVAWAVSVLREQDMPADELRVVLTTSDRELIRHVLDLHLERLEERLVSQKQDVEAIGRILGGGWPGGPSFVRPVGRPW
jgi:hypothetical protein